MMPTGRRPDFQSGERDLSGWTSFIQGDVRAVFYALLYTRTVFARWTIDSKEKKGRGRRDSAVELSLCRSSPGMRVRDPVMKAPRGGVVYFYRERDFRGFAGIRPAPYFRRPLFRPIV